MGSTLEIDTGSAASGRETIPARLEASRKELLDLGLRNSLLNFRPSKAKGVTVVDELSTEVFRILVQNSKSMTFAPAVTEEWKELEEQVQPREGVSALQQVGTASTTVDAINTIDAVATQAAMVTANHSSTLEQPLLAQPGDEDINGKPAARHRDSKLQTNLPSAQLQARLLNTFLAARTYIEEQGVNVLFLSLGMLNWYENEQSPECHYAPLVLVPVRLERADALDRFRVAYTGEDVGDNLSLVTKLKNDFGISLPTFPVIEDLNLSTYFSSVKDALRTQPRWAVDENAIALAFFSFGKFLMYKDLDAASWSQGTKPAENAIVKALLEDGFSIVWHLRRDSTTTSNTTCAVY